jgi:HK97 family phage major capsid protein
MKYSLKLKKQKADKIEASKAVIAVADKANRAMTEDESKQVSAFNVEVKALNEQIAQVEAQELAEASVAALQPAAIPVQIGEQPATATSTIIQPGSFEDFMKPPAAQPRLYNPLRAAPDAKTAYRFGMWLCATLGFGWAKNKAPKMGFGDSAFRPSAILTEGTNTQGGYLVIEEFINTMILLIQHYGVFRRKCRIVPMTKTDTISLPRRTGGLTAYPVGEGVAGTESTKTWDRVNLVAKKWMVLTRMTSEVDEDSVISIGDDLLMEIAYAFAQAEDNAGFLGDGTSTYAGITGLKNALNAGAKYTQGSSNTWLTQVLADLVGGPPSLQPDFTVPLSNEWYCNKAYFYNVMVRLASGGGGNTTVTIRDGYEEGKFFGFPVNFVSAMPAATATTGICAYFGDLGAAAKFGDRRELTISTSMEASVGGQSMWERDEIGIKGTERFDIVVHERGTTTVGGPINALITG